MKTILIAIGLAVAIDAMGESRIPVAPAVAVGSASQPMPKKQEVRRSKRKGFRSFIGASAGFVLESVAIGTERDR